MKQRYTIQRGALDGVETFLRAAERRKYAGSTLAVFVYFPDREQVSPKLRAPIDHARRFVAARYDAKKPGPRGTAKRAP